jgi:hypothetical protein
MGIVSIASALWQFSNHHQQDKCVESGDDRIVLASVLRLDENSENIIHRSKLAPIHGSSLCLPQQLRNCPPSTWILDEGVLQMMYDGEERKKNQSKSSINPTKAPKEQNLNSEQLGA